MHAFWHHFQGVRYLAALSECHHMAEDGASDGTRMLRNLWELSGRSIPNT
jgi:hypothetical protein